MSIIENLAKRVIKGEYSPDLAPKLWRYYADNAAREYTREHGTGGGFGIYSPATRDETARQLAKYFEEDIAFTAAEKIGPPVVVVEFSDWGRDVNGNKTARATVDGIPVGKRRMQTGGDGKCGNGTYTALERSGYLPRWYSAASVDGSEGGFSAPSETVTVTMHRDAIRVGGWVTPAGDPSYI